MRYYWELFATSSPDPHMAILDQIPMVITEDMNAALTGTVIEYEVITALKQMAPLQAPSPDGMPPLFYQHF